MTDRPSVPRAPLDELLKEWQERSAGMTLVAVRGEDGEDDSWGLRWSDETTGQSFAQMLWASDAKLIAAIFAALAARPTDAPREGQP